jgi:UDP-glucose 4-epimerase
VVDNLSTGRLENIQQLQDEPDFSFVEGDILDESLMESMITEVDEIYHLAAIVGVKTITENRLKAFDVNTLGTGTILKFANKGKKKLMLASSSEAYGPWQRHAWTKKVAETYAMTYWFDEKLPVVIARIFDTCGPRQRFEEFANQTGDHGMIVPRFVSAALLGEPLWIYGDGTQSRCFAYVSDVVRAIIGLVETEEAIGKIFNIGSTHEIQIKDLAKKVIELTGSSSEIKYVPCEEVFEEEKKELKRSVPDISKINGLIGWRPEVGLDEILHKVIAYERERGCFPCRI